MLRRISDMEHVNHPKHYNQHPNGIECIDIIRHYTCDIANALKYLWRAGLKQEVGMEDMEKEKEDVEKAIWYVEDFYKHYHDFHCKEKMYDEMSSLVYTEVGYFAEQITEGYDRRVADAMKCLLNIGLIHKGCVYSFEFAIADLCRVVMELNNHIHDIMLKHTIIFADLSGCKNARRIWNCLRANDIRTIGDLAKLTHKEVLHWRGFGQVCYLEVCSVMKIYGAEFRNDVKWQQYHNTDLSEVEGSTIQ